MAKFICLQQLLGGAGVVGGYPNMPWRVGAASFAGPSARAKPAANPAALAVGYNFRRLTGFAERIAFLPADYAIGRRQQAYKCF